jgi:hypothetical protein
MSTPEIFMGSEAFLKKRATPMVRGPDALRALAGRSPAGKVGGGTGRAVISLRAMFRPVYLALLAAVFASPALAAKGPLETLPLGRYLCELPGDAAGPASRPVAGAWFDVVNASSYVTEGGDGTYLLTGKQLVFTRGPLRGARFERTGLRALRRTDMSGPYAKLRCVRTGDAR